jgi:23S rRNA (uracil1939-C5)-methyltransferase
MTDDVVSDDWPEMEIDSLSHDGRGVGRNASGKVVFVDYALPGERITYRSTRSRRKFSTGTTIEVQRSSLERVEPRCKVFGTCGGCALQHLDHPAQVNAKQNQLIENLEKIGGLAPDEMISPITAEPWGYRRRARLGVRDVAKKGGILVGFRERNKSYVTPIGHCDVLHPAVSSLLNSLQVAISSLSCRDRVPQVEVAVGDNATALVFRHLDPFVNDDLNTLRDFGRDHSIQVFLQPGKLSSVHPLWPESPAPLFYGLAEYDLKFYFLPTDFIQVNGPINDRLIAQLLELLDPDPNDSVLDLFCGLGNISLPLATRVGRVLGIEGDAGLVERAQRNAIENQLSNVEFLAMDLFDESGSTGWMQQDFDKVVIDPPRSGALHVVRHMDQIRPSRLIYVSCNTATLARDAEILVGQHGYRLSSAGVIDMFPHTAHVESMAVFDLT